MAAIQKTFQNEKTGMKVNLTDPIQIKAYSNEQSKKSGWKEVMSYEPTMIERK